MAKTATKKSKKKKDFSPITESIKAVTKGGVVYMPVSGKMLKRLKIGSARKFYWTAVDGVLQLSTEVPIMVIPVLDHLTSRFEEQRG